MGQITHIFASNPLDRSNHTRRNATEVKRLMKLPESKFLPLWNLEALVTACGPPRLAWQPMSYLNSVLTETSNIIFLGLEDGNARFTAGIFGNKKPKFTEKSKEHTIFANIRSLASRLPVFESAILGQARALVDWHNRHQYCAVCGAPSIVMDGGYMRVCESDTCKAQHFPRTDPVVIMLITLGERCLLGRNLRSPSLRRFSTLAGFIEPGESIEEAVRREVYEEAHVVVGPVNYHSSQPWPFPSSLMIGCTGISESEEIVIDSTELQDARWFSKNELRSCFETSDCISENSEVEIPTSDAIAHHLIKSWVQSDNGVGGHDAL